MKINNPKSLNTETLAYMGDAVYEQFVREMLLVEGGVKVNLLHRKATHYVKASAQAKAIKTLFDSLYESEQALVKRARNHKFNSKAKNADAITYKWATAFEALVGYLYLAEENDRLQWVIDNAFEIIERREA
ncbi:MAG: ribonuclease III domain-containing protein [Firmicutes bacterium]|nr:ribonuclease III domain-containing protein [Bacillota bacterium]